MQERRKEENKKERDKTVNKKKYVYFKILRRVKMTDKHGMHLTTTEDKYNEIRNIKSVKNRVDILE